jgi:TolA-binding protein
LSCLSALACLILAAPAAAQKKEIIQLQRDMAILQDAIRQTDRNVTERIAALEALLKQNLDQAEKLNAALAVIERDVAKQSDAVVLPVTSTAAKVDTLSNQFSALRDTVDESNAMVTKLRQEVADIKTHLTTLPPPNLGEGGESTGADAALGETYFTGAVSDYQRGNYEIARAGFTDFLQYAGNSPRAPEAQYYLGAIAYDAGNLDEAVRQFDLVLEKYPTGLISADAQYKKAMALFRLDRKQEAKLEFQAVLDRFATSNVAPNAKAMLEEINETKPSPLQ